MQIAKNRRERTYTGMFWLFLGPPLGYNVTLGATNPPQQPGPVTAKKTIPVPARPTSSVNMFRKVGQPVYDVAPVTSIVPATGQKAPAPTVFRSVSVVPESEATTTGSRRSAFPSAPASPRISDFSPADGAALFTIPSSCDGFLHQARKYAARTEAKALPVEFMQYWPTYDVMSPAQQQWYFYWRSEVRQGRLLATDLSYIFVHVYELINLIGVSSPQDAFAQLNQIWLHYRVTYPKLDNYLVDWIADLLAIHRLPVRPLDRYAEAQKLGVASHSSEDLLIEAWFQRGANIDELSLPRLFRLANYSASQNKFYQRYQTQIDFPSAFRKGIQAVEQVLRQQGKPGLFKRYTQQYLYPVDRPPFLSALHGFDVPTVSIAPARHWRNFEQLTANLRAIVRTSENVLRASMRSMLNCAVLTCLLSGCRQSRQH